MPPSTHTHVLRHITAALLTLALLYDDSLAGVGGGPFVHEFVRGGIDNECITGIARMPNGDVVVTGLVRTDVFVAVCSNDLSSIKASTTFGGTSSETSAGVVIGPQGQIVVAGTTESIDLPTTPGAFASLPSGYSDGFVATFSPDLQTLIACTYFGGTNADSITAIDIDESGRIFLAGATRSIYGFPTRNAWDNIHDGGKDGFLASVSINLANVLFSTYYGGTSDEVFHSITLDDSGNLLAVGTTRSQDFPTFPKVDPLYWWLSVDRPYDWTYNGGETDAMLVEFSADGSRCIVATLYGGSEADSGIGAVINGSGHLVMIGTTTSTAYIAQFNSNGRVLIRSTTFGTDGNDYIGGANEYTSDQFVVYGGPDPFVGIMTADATTFFSYHGTPRTDRVMCSVVEPDGGVLFGGVSNNDTWGFRLQRGSIDLVTPRGGEHVCIGQAVSCTWSHQDMQEDDVYSIQASTDTVTWTDLATNISADNATATLTQSMVSTQPTYFRVVSSRYHASRTAAPLSVDASPSITKQPVGGSVCNGTNIMLSVASTGVGLRYQWRKDGLNLTGQTQSTLNVVASTATEGSYDAVVSASCGLSITSASTSVTAIPTTAIESSPTDTTISESSSITFTVVAQGAGLMHQWYHNGQPITNATSSTLTIYQAKESDAGLYACRVTGTCGNAEAPEFVLTVKPATGIQEETTSAFEIYPNPATDHIVLVGTRPLNRIVIYDSFGRTVLETESLGVAKVDLSVSSLARGWYIVRSDSFSRQLMIAK